MTLGDPTDVVPGTEARIDPVVGERREPAIPG